MTVQVSQHHCGQTLYLSQQCGIPRFRYPPPGEKSPKLVSTEIDKNDPVKLQDKPKDSYRSLSRHHLEAERISDIPSVWPRPIFLGCNVFCLQLEASCLQWNFFCLQLTILTFLLPIGAISLTYIFSYFTYNWSFCLQWESASDKCLEEL